MSFLSDYESASSLSTLQAASRFDSYFDVYGLSLKQDGGREQRMVTLIARSPASPAVQALAANLGRFERGALKVGIILARIAPVDALDVLAQSLTATGHGEAGVVIRWAKDRALHDAHERLTLGRTLCWTGDAMRRAEDARGSVDRVDDANTVVLAAANASFAALWRVSKPLPKTALKHTPMCEEEFVPSRGHNLSPVPGEAAIVHLEDYLRARRH